MREATWARVGQSVEGISNIQEVLEKAKLNYSVAKGPLTFRDEKEVIDIPKLVATFRTDTKQFKGIVGEDYQVIQNHEAFDFINNLEADMEFVRAGESSNGTTWVISRFPEVEVLGDAIHPHLIFQNGHNGKVSLKAAVCMLRIVCQNQFNATFADAANTIVIRHSGDMDSKLATARETIVRTMDYISHYQDLAERFATKKLSNSVLQSIIREFVADEAKIKEESLAFDRLQYFKKAYNEEDNQNFIGTAWGIMNAYSDFVTHLPAGRKTDTISDKQFIRVSLESRNIDRMVAMLTEA